MILSPQASSTPGYFTISQLASHLSQDPILNTPQNKWVLEQGSPSASALKTLLSSFLPTKCYSKANASQGGKLISYSGVMAVAILLCGGEVYEKAMAFCQVVLAEQRRVSTQDGLMRGSKASPHSTADFADDNAKIYPSDEGLLNFVDHLV